MFHVYWPATACLTLFLIVGVIIAMLRCGPRLCGLRHTTFVDEENGEWDDERAYEQKVSYG